MIVGFKSGIYMDNSAAYHAGQVAGIIMGLMILLGICVFFIVALVKAISTRRTGWIIAAAVSAVPFLIFFALFMVGFVAGFKRGLNHSSEAAAARRGEPSQLLSATMTPVSGNAVAYQISLPDADAWAKKDSKDPFDYIFSYRDAYIGLIPEEIGVGSPQRIYEISRKNLEARATHLTTTTPTPVEIDSRSWLTYDATATISGIDIKYRFYVYADAHYTFQIVSWTGASLFERDAPVFDRVAKSFKFPK